MPDFSHELELILKANTEQASRMFKQLGADMRAAMTELTTSTSRATEAIRVMSRDHQESMRQMSASLRENQQLQARVTAEQKVLYDNLDKSAKQYGITVDKISKDFEQASQKNKKAITDEEAAWRKLSQTLENDYDKAMQQAEHSRKTAEEATLRLVNATYNYNQALKAHNDEEAKLEKLVANGSLTLRTRNELMEVYVARLAKAQAEMQAQQRLEEERTAEFTKQQAHMDAVRDKAFADETQHFNKLKQFYEEEKRLLDERNAALTKATNHYKNEETAINHFLNERRTTLQNLEKDETQLKAAQEAELTSYKTSLQEATQHVARLKEEIRELRVQQAHANQAFTEKKTNILGLIPVLSTFGVGLLSIKTLFSEIGNIVSNVVNIFRGLFNGLQSGIMAWTQMTQNVTQFTNETRNLTSMLGFTAKEASGLQVIFNSTGASAYTLNAALAAMLDKAGKNAEQFRLLGAATRDSKNQLLPAHDILLNLADAYERAGNKQQALSNLIGIFSSFFASSIVPVITLGRDRIEEMTGTLAKLGLTFDDVGLTKSNAVRNGMAMLHQSFIMVQAAIVTGLQPAFSEFVALLLSALPTIIKLVQQLASVFNSFLKGIMGGFGIEVDKDIKSLVADLSILNTAEQNNVQTVGELNQAREELNRKIKELDIATKQALQPLKENEDALQALIKSTRAYYDELIRLAEGAVRTATKELQALKDAKDKALEGPKGDLEKWTADLQRASDAISDVNREYQKLEEAQRRIIKDNEKLNKESERARRAELDSANEALQAARQFGQQLQNDLQGYMDGVRQAIDGIREIIQGIREQEQAQIDSLTMQLEALQEMIDAIRDAEAELADQFAEDNAGGSSGGGGGGSIAWNMMQRVRARSDADIAAMSENLKELQEQAKALALEVNAAEVRLLQALASSLELDIVDQSERLLEITVELGDATLRLESAQKELIRDFEGELRLLDESIAKNKELLQTLTEKEALEERARATREKELQLADLLGETELGRLKKEKDQLEQNQLLHRRQGETRAEFEERLRKQELDNRIKQLEDERDIAKAQDDLRAAQVKEEITREKQRLQQKIQDETAAANEIKTAWKAAKDAEAAAHKEITGLLKEQQKLQDEILKAREKAEVERAKLVEEAQKELNKLLEDQKKLQQEIEEEQKKIAEAANEMKEVITSGTTQVQGASNSMRANRIEARNANRAAIRDLEAQAKAIRRQIAATRRQAANSIAAHERDIKGLEQTAHTTQSAYNLAAHNVDATVNALNARITEINTRYDAEIKPRLDAIDAANAAIEGLEQRRDEILAPLIADKERLEEDIRSKREEITGIEKQYDELIAGKQKELSGLQETVQTLRTEQQEVLAGLNASLQEVQTNIQNIQNAATAQKTQWQAELAEIPGKYDAIVESMKDASERGAKEAAEKWRKAFLGESSGGDAAGGDFNENVGAGGFSNVYKKDQWFELGQKISKALKDGFNDKQFWLNLGEEIAGFIWEGVKKGWSNIDWKELLITGPARRNWENFKDELTPKWDTGDDDGGKKTFEALGEEYAKALYKALGDFSETNPEIVEKAFKKFWDELGKNGKKYSKETFQKYVEEATKEGLEQGMEKGTSGAALPETALAAKNQEFINKQKSDLDSKGEAWAQDIKATISRTVIDGVDKTNLDSDPNFQRSTNQLASDFASTNADAINAKTAQSRSFKTLIGNFLVAGLRGGTGEATEQVTPSSPTLGRDLDTLATTFATVWGIVFGKKAVGKEQTVEASTSENTLAGMKAGIALAATKTGQELSKEAQDLADAFVRLLNDTLGKTISNSLLEIRVGIEQWWTDLIKYFEDADRTPWTKGVQERWGEFTEGIKDTLAEVFKVGARDQASTGILAKWWDSVKQFFEEAKLWTPQVESNWREFGTKINEVLAEIFAPTDEEKGGQGQAQGGSTQNPGTPTPGVPGLTSGTRPGESRKQDQKSAIQKWWEDLKKYLEETVKPWEASKKNWEEFFEQIAGDKGDEGRDKGILPTLTFKIEDWWKNSTTGVEKMLHEMTPWDETVKKKWNDFYEGIKSIFQSLTDATGIPKWINEILQVMYDGFGMAWNNIMPGMQLAYNNIRATLMAIVMVVNDLSTKLLSTEVLAEITNPGSPGAQSPTSGAQLMSTGRESGGSATLPHAQGGIYGARPGGYTFGRQFAEAGEPEAYVPLGTQHRQGAKGIVRAIANIMGMHVGGSDSDSGSMDHGNAGGEPTTISHVPDSEELMRLVQSNFGVIQANKYREMVDSMGVQGATESLWNESAGGVMATTAPTNVGIHEKSAMGWMRMGAAVKASIQGMAQVAGWLEALKSIGGFFTMPIIGQPITQHFMNPSSLYASGYHSGVDINAFRGQPVLAPAYGQITKVGSDGSYGNFVTMEHSEGLTSLFGHLLNAAVAGGEKVRQGQTVGYADNTGYSFGDHLHWEVRRNGNLIDPLSMIGQGSGNFAGMDPTSPMYDISNMRVHGLTAPAAAAALPAYVRDMIAKIAKEQFGWGADEALFAQALAFVESSGIPASVNPDSRDGATGIFQLIRQNWHYLPRGAASIGHLDEEIIGGLNYIARRQEYGYPSKAWVHESVYGWYDRGGLAGLYGPEVAGLAKNGKPELVLDGDSTAALASRGLVSMKRGSFKEVAPDLYDVVNGSKGRFSDSSGNNYNINSTATVNLTANPHRTRAQEEAWIRSIMREELKKARGGG